MLLKLERMAHSQKALEANLPQIFQRSLAQRQQMLERMDMRLQLLDPRLVLQRGYALLSDDRGRPVTSVQEAVPGAALTAQLCDGAVDLVVTQPRLL